MEKLTPRLHTTLALAVAAGLALGVSSGSGANAVTIRATVNKALGKTILVDTGGFTLYRLTSERKGSVACVGSCAKVWPPLLVGGTAKPVAGTGLTAGRLGTLRRPDGHVQVTYAGYALYLYSGDVKAGEANGQGLEQLWYALTPTGVVTKASPARASGGGSSTVATPAPTSTQAAPTPVSTSSSPATATAGSCPPGETIPQGSDQGNGNSSTNDGDDDNQGGADDGDGCL
jgi:predicted lipoprotein with Yx(FWY)xxD motif